MGVPAFYLAIMFLLKLFQVDALTYSTIICIFKGEANMIIIEQKTSLRRVNSIAEYKDPLKQIIF